MEEYFLKNHCKDRERELNKEVILNKIITVFTHSLKLFVFLVCYCINGTRYTTATGMDMQ